MTEWKLNARAAELSQHFIDDGDLLGVGVQVAACGARLIDCGIQSPGGLEAGRRLAEICLAGLGGVTFVPAPAEFPPGPAVMVATDHPLAGCMASQYAGWQIARDGYFAMGSGPMRAAAAKEPLFARIGMRERPNAAVGILESRKLPSDVICQELATACGVDAKNLMLFVAPTASMAGSVQVVARSVETALAQVVGVGL